VQHFYYFCSFRHGSRDPHLDRQHSVVMSDQSSLTLLIDSIDFFEESPGDPALMMAISLRKPPSGLIHHSDRGVSVRQPCLSGPAETAWHDLQY
jgi:hypothetical protein